MLALVTYVVFMRVKKLFILLALHIRFYIVNYVSEVTAKLTKLKYLRKN